jgi:hypothetical protein
VGPGTVLRLISHLRSLREDLVHNDPLVVFRLLVRFCGGGVGVLLVKDEFIEIVFGLVNRIGNVAFLASSLFHQFGQLRQYPDRLRFLYSPFYENCFFHLLGVRCWIFNLGSSHSFVVDKPASHCGFRFYRVRELEYSQPCSVSNARISRKKAGWLG